MTALAAYVLHIPAIRAVGMEEATGPALPALLVFAAAAMLLATVWTRRFCRGPLEYLLHAATRVADRITTTVWAEPNDSARFRNWSSPRAS
ncbi:hypothetical protein GCM10022403_050880 [Streptomyces coacervatus]|uniref:DUF418 domain-containing protein n=1 Tax=Streptomyces coacervatus TaxID=647381 RepID=A0ABP7I3D9_9ACTN